MRLVLKNDVENYRKLLFRITRIKLETKVSSLNVGQLILVSEANKQVEGFQIGIIAEDVPKKKILDVKKNKQNLIIQYLIEGYGWLLKIEAINLVEKNIVDAVIVKRKMVIFFSAVDPTALKQII
jgi:hypothetical protein